MKKIALISVSDKTGIDSIASELSKMGYDIISTGGTAKYLISKGIKINRIDLPKKIVPSSRIIKAFLRNLYLLNLRSDVLLKLI